MMKRIYKIKIFRQKCLQFCDTILPPPLAMVTLGNATQRGSHLFVSRHPRWQSQVGVALSWHEIAVGFANFDERLFQSSLA
jgi:hypothetical protein